MTDSTRTAEQIQGTIRAARDSVWVIEDAIEKLSQGATADNNIKGDIDRNVSHLKIVVSDPDVVASEQDITDLHAAIELGEAKLAEDIWTADQ
jgi:hypothetical protein